MIRIAKSLLLSFIAFAIIINYQLASLTFLTLGIESELSLLSLNRKVVNYQLTQLGSAFASFVGSLILDFLFEPRQLASHLIYTSGKTYRFFPYETHARGRLRG